MQNSILVLIHSTLHNQTYRKYVVLIINLNKILCLQVCPLHEFQSCYCQGGHLKSSLKIKLTEVYFCSTNMKLVCHIQCSEPVSFHLLYLKPIPKSLIPILSYHLILSLSSGHFPRDFPTKILCIFCTCSILLTWPAHHILLNLTILTIPNGAYKSQSFH
jgi:hypothetical protein